MNGLEEAEDTLTVQVETGGPSATGASAPHPPNNADVPKPKRLACMICRKRKLRCDGNRPRCSTCTRLGHDCAYDEVRRKSGPKRGYVKALEERLSASAPAPIPLLVNNEMTDKNWGHRASRDSTEDPRSTRCPQASCARRTTRPSQYRSQG